MQPRSRISKPASIETEIVETARAGKIKLRFDKVVRRLTGDLKAALAGVLPEGRSAVITVTAPIKHPAKTAETLREIMQGELAHGELSQTIYGNSVRVRLIDNVAARMPQVLTFVHNPESDARLILDIAESHLLERD